MRRSLVILLCSTFICQTTLARDIFVNNAAGDDSRDGSGEAITGTTIGPYKTIRRALSVAKKGDRVILAKTNLPYRESVTLQAGRNSGHPRLPFTLIGNGATLDGRSPISSSAWEHHRGDVYRIRLSRKSHARLFLDDQPVSLLRVRPSAGAIPNLQLKQSCLHRGYLYFRTEAGKSPSHYNLSLAALRVGITLYEVRHVIIQDLVIIGFQLDGVNAHDGVFDGVIVNVQSKHHGRAGFAVSGASRVRLINCQSDAKLLQEKPARVSIVNSKLGS